jgi:purine-nucleoside phosphorylase
MFDAHAELNNVDQAEQLIRSRVIGIFPTLAFVLGSGLGGFVERLTDTTTLQYSEIPNFCCPTVASHFGKLAVGNISGKRVAVLAGRVHCYEGYSLPQIVFPIRVLARCGVRRLILTNAAGAVNPAFALGSLALISDHINLIGNPLVGCGDTFGTSFIDMSNTYSPELRARATAAASRLGITVREGVYMAVSGPSYETPAEIRAFRTLGADLVGMSTAPEAIAARQCALEVLGLSLVTNAAAGITGEPITHDEVIRRGIVAAEQIQALLDRFAIEFA